MKRLKRPELEIPSLELSSAKEGHMRDQAGNFHCYERHYCHTHLGFLPLAGSSLPQFLKGVASLLRVCIRDFAVVGSLANLVIEEHNGRPKSVVYLKLVGFPRIYLVGWIHSAAFNILGLLRPRPGRLCSMMLFRPKTTSESISLDDTIWNSEVVASAGLSLVHFRSTFPSCLCEEIIPSSGVLFFSTMISLDFCSVSLTNCSDTISPPKVPRYDVEAFRQKSTLPSEKRPSTSIKLKSLFESKLQHNQLMVWKSGLTVT